MSLKTERKGLMKRIMKYRKIAGNDRDLPEWAAPFLKITLAGIVLSVASMIGLSKYDAYRARSQGLTQEAYYAKMAPKVFDLDGDGKTVEAFIPYGARELYISDRLNHIDGCNLPSIENVDVNSLTPRAMSSSEQELRDKLYQSGQFQLHGKNVYK